MSGKKTGGTGETIDLSAFDLENPEFPAELDELAFRSGGYPYDARAPRKAYEKDLRGLQIELLKLQRWVRNQGTRIVIVFEGRDAAGKGGTIKRFMAHLNPRHARAVALSKPTETERGQWYFQRYIVHLPTAGDVVLFDRSWYNRAGVEPVMGFCTPEQTVRFLAEVPEFESSLARDGFRLFKFWLTVGQAMQLKRFHARRHDPLKSWKLSKIDLASLGKWDDYTSARDAMFDQTHTEVAPWTVIRSNDKRRARLNVIRHVLSSIDYAEKDVKVVGVPDSKIVGSDDRFFADA
ncbi:polyphosphate kinase 2 [bacterium BMS3Bbin10]|nr:polyphosphate kinase 2 [bacterium BMS3Bbin10]